MPSSPGSTVTVRREFPKDIGAVRAVITDAFGRSEEADLVDALRCADVPTISLVAEADGEVVGHLLFSKAEVADRDWSVPIWALAPMAVAPAYQRQGIGKALVAAGLSACRETRYPAVIVLGHPEYYPKFGFEMARPHGIECPYDAPDEAFMVLALRPGGLSGIRGVIRYHKAFDGV